ncbi:MAG: hypothetical protein FJ267_20365, partial [Planctomycetes bacterium]|nr:hypothetical protein [Planctomycetota bacterium]
MSSQPDFQSLTEDFRKGGPATLFDRLAQVLIEQQDFHRLFDARCQQKKFELGLPLYRPTSFEDVPAEKRAVFEEAYMDAAREAGRHLLADKKLGQAWMYFHAIRETDAIKQAIEDFPLETDSGEATEELIDVAFSKMVHPVKGMQVLLRTHGTCNTITSLDQQFRNLAPEQRSECASVLVRSLHDDLVRSVQYDVGKRAPSEPLSSTLRELTSGREWLFGENNY